MADSVEKNLNDLAKDVSSSNWMDIPEYKKENRKWLRKSLEIALRIHEVLEEKGMSRTELAKALGVKKQQVSKIMKGQENLTLETICKFEEVLGIDLILTPDEEENVNVAHVKMSATTWFDFTSVKKAAPRDGVIKRSNSILDVKGSVTIPGSYAMGTYRIVREENEHIDQYEKQG